VYADVGVGQLGGVGVAQCVYKRVPVGPPPSIQRQASPLGAEMRSSYPSSAPTQTAQAANRSGATTAADRIIKRTRFVCTGTSFRRQGGSRNLALMSPTAMDLLVFAQKRDWVDPWSRPNQRSHTDRSSGG
jgi:hypothetical protein